MKRNPKSSHGTANCTKPSKSQSTKANNRNPPPDTETISRFFKKVEEKRPSASSLNDSDFLTPKTPAPTKNIAKIFTDAKKMRSTRSSRKTTKTNTSNEEKKLLAIGKTSDINMDELQLAMALSKSLEPQETNLENDNDAVFPSTQQITENVRENLNQFRLGQTKPATSTEKSQANLLKGGTGRKKKKFKYTTPPLLMRDEEVRGRLINEKIAKILQNSSDYYQNVQNVVENTPRNFLRPFSKMLQPFFDEKSPYFANAAQFEVRCFYVTELGLDESKAPCGGLLKNWGEIPGRHTSPIREISQEQKPSKLSTENLAESLLKSETSEKFVAKADISISSVSQNLNKRQRCISPDLFASGSDSEDENDNTNATHVQNNTGLIGNYENSPKVDLIACDKPSFDKIEDKIEIDDRGICYYENFNEDSLEIHENFNESEDIIMSDNEIPLESHKSLEIQTESTNFPRNENNFEVNFNKTAFESSFKTKSPQKTPESEDLNITDYVHALLNAKSFEESTCPEKCFDGNSLEDKMDFNSAILDIEISQNDDFIDLSQDSDHENFDKPLETNTFKRNVSSTSLASSISTATNESICISDEELNYSCMNATHISNSSHSNLDISNTPTQSPLLVKSIRFKSISSSDTKTRNLRNKFAISDSESDDENQLTDIGNECEVDVDELLAKLKRKTSSKTCSKSAKDESEVDNDPELQEAIKLSLIEAEKEQKLRETQEKQLINEAGSSQHTENLEILNVDTSFPTFDNYIRHFEENQNGADDYSTPTKQKSPEQETNTKINSTPVINNLNGNKPGDKPDYDEFDLLVDATIPTCFDKAQPAKKPQHPRVSELTGTHQTPDKFSGKALDAPAGTPGTPQDGIYVKTSNITPMPGYEHMATPEIHGELTKYGLKKLKRRRGVQMLQHIYNCMHLPLQEQFLDVESEENQPSKRPKRLSFLGEKQDGGKEVIQNGRLEIQYGGEGVIEINPKISESEPLEEMIFEKTRSKRIASCALPFHIAWHNFLCVNRHIWQSVLVYEPLQVEVLYKMFKQLGFKYHVQDMIAFFDRKCITIRIKQNN